MIIHSSLMPTIADSALQCCGGLLSRGPYQYGITECGLLAAWSVQRQEEFGGLAAAYAPFAMRYIRCCAYVCVCRCVCGRVRECVYVWVTVWFTCVRARILTSRAKAVASFGQLSSTCGGGWRANGPFCFAEMLHLQTTRFTLLYISRNISFVSKN